MTAESERAVLARPGLQPGARVGRYVLGARLGEGALGVVHAAFDPELDRALAIKLLRARPPQTGVRDPRVHEAQATARLAHRSLVRIHDVGTHDGAVFIAMERIDGPTLRQWLATPRSWREVVAVLREAGAGLLAAHEAGLVHRDFKPDNVLLARDGRVVVTDFGLASAIDHVAADDTTDAAAIEISQEGGLQGTAAYAAPEQLEGRSVDARADQFSFCVVLYEALWGERPFEGDTIDALAANITRGNVRTPTDRRVPWWLRRVVLRGLASVPADRYADMSALLAALGPRTRPRSIAVAATLAATTAVLGVVALRPEPPAPRYCDRVAARLHGLWDAEARHAVEAAFVATGEPSATDAATTAATRLDAFATAWVDAQLEACRAQHDTSVAPETVALRMTCLERQLGKTAAIVQGLRAADSAAVLRAPAIVAGLGEPGRCLDDAELSRRAIVRADVDRVVQAENDALLAHGEALFDAAKFAQAGLVAETLLARAQAVDDRWLVADALLLRAAVRQWVDESTAEQAFHDALSAALAVEHQHVALLAMTGLLELWNPDTDGGIARAEQWGEHAAAIISALGGSAVFEGELAMAMGNVYIKSGRYEDAEAAYNRALALPLSDTEHVLLANAHTNLGGIAAAHGRYAEALTRFREGLALLSRAYGLRHPAVAGAAINVGSALAELGDLAGARDEHRRALAVLEENLGPEHPALAPALRMLAWNGLARREFVEAMPYAERALAIARREEGERSESTARSLGMVSAIELELGRTAQAREHAESALAIAREVLGEEHPAVAELAIESGLAAARERDDDAARRHFAEAIALRRRAFGTDDAEVARALGGLAELELARGNHAAAIAAATQAFDIATAPATERGVARADATFLLARALVAGGGAAGRTRAVQLAEDARRDLELAGPGWRARRDEITAWLRRVPRE